METNTEITDLTITPEQESKEIATIAKASIANIEANKKAYEDLRDEYKGTKAPELTDPEFKATLKKLTQGSGALVKARTAATKLGKQETDKLDRVKVMIKSAVEELIAITADTEKEIKVEKERAEQLVADEKAEKERQAEEAKQARIAKLYELGLTHNGSYYSLGELSITPLQITQYTEAQFEGFVAQATVEFEAVKLKEAQEREAEEQRQNELIAEQQRLQQENEQKQHELNEQQALMAQMIAERTEARKKELSAKGFVYVESTNSYDYRDFVVTMATIQEATKPIFDEVLTKFESFLVELQKPKAAATPVVKPINGAVKFTEEQRETILQDVLVAEESVKSDEDFRTVSATLNFSTSHPYLDTKIGGVIFRVYPEEFLEMVSASVPDGMEAKKSGDFGKDMLYLVLTPVK